MMYRVDSHVDQILGIVGSYNSLDGIIPFIYNHLKI